MVEPWSTITSYKERDLYTYLLQHYDLANNTYHIMEPIRLLFIFREDLHMKDVKETVTKFMKGYGGKIIKYITISAAGVALIVRVYKVGFVHGGIAGIGAIVEMNDKTAGTSHTDDWFEYALNHSKEMRKSIRFFRK